jgi:hypothetical protein
MRRDALLQSGPRPVVSIIASQGPTRNRQGTLNGPTLWRAGPLKSQDTSILKFGGAENPLTSLLKDREVVAGPPWKETSYCMYYTAAHRKQISPCCIACVRKERLFIESCEPKTQGPLSGGSRWNRMVWGFYRPVEHHHQSSHP